MRHFLCLQAFGATAIGAMVYFHLVPYYIDELYIMPLIAGLTLISAISIVTPKLRGFHEFIIGKSVLTMLGMLGTFAGMAIALSRMDGSMNIEALSGLWIAISTTIAGTVSHMWLIFSVWVNDNMDKWHG